MAEKFTVVGNETGYLFHFYEPGEPLTKLEVVRPGVFLMVNAGGLRQAVNVFDIEPAEDSFGAAREYADLMRRLSAP